MLYKVNFLCRFILPHSPSLLVSLKASWLSMSGWLSKSSWLSMLRLNFKCTWKDLNSRRKLDQMFERISFKLSVSGSIYANLASFGRLIMRWRKKSISSIWLMISTRLPKLIQIWPYIKLSQCSIICRPTCLSSIQNFKIKPIEFWLLWRTFMYTSVWFWFTLDLEKSIQLENLVNGLISTELIQRQSCLSSSTYHHTHRFNNEVKYFTNKIWQTYSVLKPYIYCIHVLDYLSVSTNQLSFYS